MTALIRGAFETDPSKAQPARNKVVNTPLGWEQTWLLAALKATSHLPRGQSTNNSVPQRAFKPPTSASLLPPSRFLSVSLSLSYHACLWFIKLIDALEGHLHKLKRINKSGFMNHTLLMYESKGKALCRPSCDIRQMLSKEI